jgi:hypothetical protein
MTSITTTSGFIFVSFTGIDTSGGAAGVSVSGLKIGDIVLAAAHDGNSGGTDNDLQFFETEISVANEVQQQAVAGNKSTWTFRLVLFRPPS